MSAISGPRLVVTSPQGASGPLKNMLVEVRISLWKPDNYIGSALIFQVLTRDRELREVKKVKEHRTLKLLAERCAGFRNARTSLKEKHFLLVDAKCSAVK